MKKAGLENLLSERLNKLILIEEKKKKGYKKEEKKRKRGNKNG